MDEASATRPTAVGGRAVGFVVLLVLTWRVLARGLTPSPGGVVLEIVDGANLIFHEAGHLIFAFFGEFLHVLGGSLVQVAMPVVCAVYFSRHRQWGSCAVAVFWTGESLCGLSAYVADAERMQLPLFGEGHDWHYLLGRLGALRAAETLGRLVLGVGALTMMAGVALLGRDVLADLRRLRRAFS